MQITDSDFTRPKDEYSSYFGRPYDVLVVSDDQTTANMDPCFCKEKMNWPLVWHSDLSSFSTSRVGLQSGTQVYFRRHDFWIKQLTFFSYSVQKSIHCCLI